VHSDNLTLYPPYSTHYLQRFDRVCLRFEPRRKLGASRRPPYKKGSFIPSQESLDGEVDEEDRTRAESDPYTHYMLKTGKHRGKTRKQIHDEGDPGYIRWMHTNPKACKDSDDDHIVKKGLVHWESEVAGTVTANPTAAKATASTKSSNPAADSQTNRFRESQGRVIWITGFDVIGLFHMTEA
jgi:hypothetical protein